MFFRRKGWLRKEFDEKLLIIRSNLKVDCTKKWDHQTYWKKVLILQKK